MQKRYKIEKNNKSKVVSLLEDIESKKVEIVNMTPFDLYEDNLDLKILDQRLESIYELINSNPEITHQYVKKALLPIQDTLESMDNKLNGLLPKSKSTKSTLLLRDGITKELFEVFVNAAGSNSQYKKDLRCAQLRIAYTILFYTGLRVNEIRCFQEHDIQNAIKSSQFSVIHFKQNQPHIHIISDIAVKELKKLKPYYKIIFVKYKFNYLFGKNKPLDKKYFIKIINKDLKNTCQINQIPYNIKSHSFRINMITNLLKHTSVQDAADIIGHKDTKSTMAYKRYVLNKTEILDLLNKIDKSTQQN
jgi:integrase/recombinase XerD